MGVKLQWMPQLAVDRGTIDSQHQSLFDLYNQVEALPEDQIDRRALFQDLMTYALVHFRDEEAFMAQVGFPAADLETHRTLHGEFVRTVEGLGGQPTYRVLDYIQEWLLRHIMVEDHKVSRYLLAQGPGTVPPASA
jgi:hemerythrin